MKKLTFSIITLCAVISCVDQNYDMNKLNPEVDASVIVDDKQEPVTVDDFIKSGATVDKDGNLFVKSTETTTTVKDVSIKYGEPVKIPGADMNIELPTSKNFPSDDVYEAMNKPYFEIKLSIEKQLAFTYNAKIKVNGKEFPITAEIPALNKEVIIVVSEKGDIVPAEEKGNRVNASPISNFREIYKKSPRQVKISDVELLGHSTKADFGSRKAGEESIDFVFKGSSVCPLEFKKGVSFTVRDTVALEKVDLSEYEGFKRVKVYSSIKHNFPFSMTPVLVSPTDIDASCTPLAGANYPDYTTEEITLTGNFPNGIQKQYDKAIIDLKVCYIGNEATGSVRKDMTFQLTINKYTVTME